jgi:hypothetical protein
LLVWSLLAVVSVLVLGLYAYLSLVTVGFADAYLFTDVSMSMKVFSDVIM